MKDLPLIGSFAPRKVRWIAKAELFRFAPFGALISSLGAFPVKRGEHDRDAVRTVYEVLRAGEPLGIFPEGTRVTDPMKRKPIRRSFVSFAVNAGCGILPVAVRYEDGPFGRGRLFCKVRISFGEIWTPEPGRKYERAELDALAETLMSGIYEKVQTPKKV